MKPLAWLMTGTFLFAAALQWNDPDPLVWIAFYGLAAAASLGAALGRAWWLLELVAMGTAFVVVVSLAPSVAGARVEAFTSFHMQSADDEVVRELVGAAIALLWTGALVVRRRRMRDSTGGV